MRRHLFRPTSVTNYKDKVLPPVAAADLVDANGRCAGARAAAGASGDAAPRRVPMIPQRSRSR